MARKIPEQDRERILFSAGFGKEINMKLSANISSPDSGKMVTKAINDYKAAGLPELTPEWLGKGAPPAAKKWLIDYLSKYFRFNQSKPQWLGEPSWIFMNGFPMTFSHQLSGESSLSRNGKKETYYFTSNENNGIVGIAKTCIQEEDPNGIVVTFEEETK